MKNFGYTLGILVGILITYFLQLDYSQPFTLITEPQYYSSMQKQCIKDENCMDIMTFNQLPECFPIK